MHTYKCSGYKHFTQIDERTSLPLSVRGTYIATTGTISEYMVSSILSRLFSGDSGDNGTTTLLSHRIFQPDSILYQESAQAVILAQAPLVADISTLH